MKTSTPLLFALPFCLAAVSTTATAQGEAPAATAPAAKVRVTADRIEVLEPISFNSGKAVILPSSNAVLDELAAVVKQEAERVAGIRIEGHTDNTGDPVFNAQLSDQRAHAVEKALVDRGIAADRIVARGFGPKRPIADNATNEGRAQNRRVEIVILSTAQLTAAKDASIAHLTSKSGVVEMWVDGAWKAIDLGTAVNSGDKVRVAKGATADLTLKDDTRLHLGDGAILTLNAPKLPAKYNADATLEWGSIWVTLSELSLGKLLNLTTTTAAADFDMGEKLVEVKTDGTNFANFGGRPLWLWNVDRSGKSTQLAMGNGAQVKAGAKPSIAALPQAPKMAPISGSRFAVPGLPFASWDAVSGAESIRVIFAAGAAGLGRLTEVVLPGTATSIDGAQVPGGMQWMAVQSAGAGFKSPPSAQQKVSIIPVQSDSPFAGGTTTQVAAGTRLSFAPPTLCKLDDGPFLASIVLDKVGSHTLFCNGPLATGLTPWTFDVAALELVAIAPSANSPFKTASRKDFEIRSTAPLGKNLTFVVDGPSQYDGIHRMPTDSTHAWASFVPETDGKLPSIVRVVRHGKTVASAPVK